MLETNIRTQTLAPQVAGLVQRRQDIRRKPAAANKAMMGRAVTSIHSFLLDDPHRFVAASQPMGSSVPRWALHAPLCKRFRQKACPLSSQGKTLTGYDCVDVANDLKYVCLVCNLDRKGNDVFLGHVGAALPMVRPATMAVRIAVTFPGSMPKRTLSHWYALFKLAPTFM